MSERTETEGQRPREDTTRLIGNPVQFASAAGPGAAELIRRLDSARRELHLGRLAQARDGVAGIEAALESGTPSTTAELERLAPVRLSLKVLAGRILQRTGKVAEADASFAAAITSFKQLSTTAMPAWVLRDYGAALYETGRFDEAREALRQARESGDQSYETVLYLGVLALRDGDVTAAKGFLQDAVKQEPQAPEAALNLAMALERSGEGAEAGDCYLVAGSQLMEQARQPEALEAFRKAVRLKRDDPAARLALGDAWRLMGKYDEAIAAVEQDSDYPHALGIKGAALLALGRKEDALRALDRAVELEPTYAFGLGVRGEVLRQLGRPAEALESLDRAVAKDPGNAILQWSRGEALRDLDRPAEALESLDRAMAVDPRNASLLATRGEVLRLLGRNEEALAVLDRAIDLAPQLAFAHGTRAGVLWGADRLEEALAAADRAVELEPEYRFPHVVKGEVLTQLGRLTEALPALDRALELDPGDAFTLADRGDVLRRLGRWDDALGALDKALELKPDYPFAYLCRSGVLIALQRPNDALVALDRAIELKPSDAYAQMRRAKVLRLLDRPDEALAAAERALGLGPSPDLEADALVVRADALRGRGKWQEALESLDRAVKLQPQLESAHGLRGDVLRMLGRLQEAQASLERAIELDPEGAFAIASLGEIFRVLGRYREARARIEKALALTGRRYAWAMGVLGLIELGTGEFAAAFEAFDSSIAQYESNPAAHLGKGYSLRLLERLPEATSVLAQAAERFPGVRRAKVLLGACLVLGGRRADAEVILRDVSKDLESVALPEPQELSDLGWAQTLLGRYDDAMRTILDALSMAPRNQWVRFDLALTTMMAKRYDLGLEEYQRAVKEASEFAEPERRRGLALIALRELEGATRVNELERDGPLAEALALLDGVARGVQDHGGGSPDRRSV
jgi:tetratricopeptide (TPR) repeat protein